MKKKWILAVAILAAGAGLCASAGELDAITGASWEYPPTVPRPEPVVRKQIMEWLNSHWLMSVATADAVGNPYISGVVYAHEEFTVYFVSKRDTNKILNILKNPRVAYTIWDPVKNIRDLKALQVMGTARILEGAERVRVSALFEGKTFGADQAVVAIEPLVARWTDKSSPPDESTVIRFCEEAPRPELPVPPPVIPPPAIPPAPR